MSDRLQLVGPGEPIRASQQNLLIEGVRRRTVVDSNVNAVHDSIGQHTRTSVTRAGGQPLIQLRLKAVKKDHLECVTWDGGVEGIDILLVAKPYLLRETTFDGKIRNGIKYTYDPNDSQRRVATRVADSTERNEEVHPRYVSALEPTDDPNDDLIYANLSVEGGTDVTFEDAPIELLDTGGNRHFHADEDFGRIGIVWLSIASAGANVILVLDPTSFCICCEFAAPALAPRGIGGNDKQFWHCDAGSDKVYPINPTTLIIGEGVTTPGLNPTGIGGTDLKVWHVDGSTPNKGLYELDVDTLSVIRGPALNAELQLPLGCGGDDSIIYVADDITGDRIKIISPTTFGIVLTRQSPELTPTGIGGDSKGAWHCDADNSFIFELERPLMAVVRSKKSPREVPQGMGGKFTGRSGCS